MTPRFCRCGHVEGVHHGGQFFCRAFVLGFSETRCDCTGFVDEERVREEIRS